MDIADPLRRQLTVHKQNNGDIVLRWPRGFLLLSQAEVDRMYAVTNEKARLQCFPAAPKSRPESPQTDDLTFCQ
jgi:hypothetical protein